MKNLLTNCYTVLVVILLGIVSCKHSNQETQSGSGVTPTSTYYQPSKLIDSLTKIFLDSAKCQGCLNELYINKVYEGEAYITFKVRKYSKEYFKNKKPLFYFLMEGKKIFVFTGAEDYILGNQKNTASLQFVDDKSMGYELCVNFHIEDGSIKMLKVAGTPFMPEFNQVVPTDDSIPKFDSKKDYSH